MLNIKPSFRTSILSDFNNIQNNRLAQSSYKHIAFPLGCSSSEFQMSIDDREVSLLDNKGNVTGFVRIKSIMFTHIYLDLFCIEDPKTFSKSLKALQAHLIKSYHTKKFFVQLLEYEVLEHQSVEHCGFKHEACLRQHIWINGVYNDMYIYGSPLYA